MTYSADTDVVDQLGTLGTRLPGWVVVSTFRNIAHATITDRLGREYPDGIPLFSGASADVVRYAEAKLAAAEILEAIRVNLPDLGDAPDRLRASVEETLTGGIVGYPPGSAAVDVDGDPGTPGVAAVAGPRVSSFTPLSAFPDPYAPARLDPYRDAALVDRPIRYQ